MGQFIRVNGDYNIKCSDGSKITLDTGPGVGVVRITGDLIVEGQNTNVAAENLHIEDNIIVVNHQETGAGITLTYAGFQVDRGSLPPVGFLYDEINDTWLLPTGGPAIVDGYPASPFDYSQGSRIRLKEILTSSATDEGDLTLIGTGTGVVKVIGTDNYEIQVTHDDDIPNKKYVDDSILNNPTFQIAAPQSQDTKVVIADKEILPNISSQPGSLAFFNTSTGYTTFGESAVSVIVDNRLISQFFTNRVEIGDLELGGGVERNEISTKSGITNENVIIRTQGTGKLQTNYAIQLERIGTSGETPPTAFPYTPLTPAYVSGSTLLYASGPSIGTTGLYFTNDSLIERHRNGELISKNKALVFSMIF